jgi:iron complex outermembrane receptor protein/vitamin B12 transporter
MTLQETTFGISRLTAPAILIMLIPYPAWAEDEPESLETLVVTASRLDTPASELSSSTAVISRDWIELRNTATAADTLRQVPGMHIVQQGGRGGITSIYLRGGDPNFTAVLIDGVKVNDPTNAHGGSYDLAKLDLAGIGRIEVVRGPMSPIYGSDALAGVVNVISQIGQSGAEITAEAGSAGYVSTDLSAGAKLGVFEAGLAVQYDREDGAGYEGKGLIGRFSANLSEQTQAGMAFRFHRTESASFPDDSGGASLAVIRETEKKAGEEFHLRLSFDHTLTGAWHLSFAGSRYQRTEYVTSPGIAPGIFDGVPPSYTNTTFTRDQIVGSVGVNRGSVLSLLAGAEWQREDGTSEGVLDLGFPLSSDFHLERNTLSAFTEIGFRHGPIALQGGLRSDHPDAIADKTTARGGVAFRFPDGLTEIRANWGQGFKAPGFFGLAHPIVGNPSLRSESGASVDFMVTRRLPNQKGEFGISIFRNEYEDLVDFDAATFSIVNRSSVVTQGAEFAIELALGDRATLRSHATFTDAEIRDSEAQLSGRPEWRGGAIFEWEVSGNWRLATSVLVLSEAYASSIPTGGVFLDGYTRLDLALTWRPRADLTLRLAVDNLLDASYEEAVGFPAAGIRGRIGVSRRF